MVPYLHMQEYCLTWAYETMTEPFSKKREPFLCTDELLLWNGLHWTGLELLLIAKLSAREHTLKSRSISLERDCSSDLEYGMRNMYATWDRMKKKEALWLGWSRLSVALYGLDEWIKWMNGRHEGNKTGICNFTKYRSKERETKTIKQKQKRSWSYPDPSRCQQYYVITVCGGSLVKFDWVAENAGSNASLLTSDKHIIVTHYRPSNAES